MKTWKLGLCLLLLFLAISPVFCSDSSTITIDRTDWEKVQSYVQISQETLKKTQTELESYQIELATLQTNLAKSSQQVTTLQTSLNESMKQIQSLETKNNRLKISLGITSGISIGLVITGLIILLIR